MHKRGADLVISLYWFLILFIIAGATVYIGLSLLWFTL